MKEVQAALAGIEQPAFAADVDGQVLAANDGFTELLCVVADGDRCGDLGDDPRRPARAQRPEHRQVLDAVVAAGRAALDARVQAGEGLAVRGQHQRVGRQRQFSTHVGSVEADHRAGLLHDAQHGRVVAGQEDGE